MIFIPQELASINFVLQQNSEGKVRTFALGELSTATGIYNKIKNCTGGEGDQKIFVESECEFTSEENVFIKKLIEAQSWAVLDGELIAGLIEKIR